MRNAKMFVCVAAPLIALAVAFTLSDPTSVRGRSLIEDPATSQAARTRADATTHTLAISPFVDPRDSWHAGPGDQFTFRTTAKCDVVLDRGSFGGRDADAADTPAQAMTLTLAGSLITTVLAASGGQLSLAVSLDVTANIGGENAEDRHLTGEAIMIMENGRVLRLGFHQDADPVSRRLIRWIVAGTHQFVPPADDQEPAIIDHLGDETGWYRASFAWSPTPEAGAARLSLERRKLAYEGASLRDRSTECRIISSHGEALFSRGWIEQSKDLSETHCLMGGAIMKTRLEATAQRTLVRRVDTAPLAWSPEQWEDAFAPGGPVTADDDQLSPADADARASMIVDELQRLADQAKVTSAEGLKLAMELAKILAAHPELIEKIRAGLDVGGYGSAASMIASALAGAAVKGSTVAADAVVGLLSSRQDLRQPMLMALHEATGATAARFAPVVLELARTSQDPAVTTAASLLAGTLYGRLSDEAARAPIRQLIDGGLAGPDDQRREMLLYAVGNTGDAALRARAYEMLSDTNVGIRLAVADVATGNADGSSVLYRLADDDDPLVAARAIRGLGELSGDRTALQKLIDIASDPAHHPDPARLAALQGLVRSRRDPAVVASLQGVAATDPNPELKALAASLVKK